MRPSAPDRCWTYEQSGGDDVDRVFRALAHATRRDIVHRSISGDEGLTELAEHYPMSFAAVHKHVAILQRAGLVTKLRIGRRTVVRADLDALRAACRLLDETRALLGGGKLGGRCLSECRPANPRAHNATLDLTEPRSVASN